MREIKFRAWDKNKEKWFKDFDIPYADEYTKEEGSCVSVNETQNCGCCSEREFYNAILMQYTGLKDKNGKEIYEGDIVTHETLGTEGGRYVIVYSNGLHNVDIENLSAVKVIGNIYENPELCVNAKVSESQGGKN